MRCLYTVLAKPTSVAFHALGDVRGRSSVVNPTFLQLHVATVGACAFVCALVASGLPTSSFTFHGFLSPKTGEQTNHSYFISPVQQLCRIMEL
jgi:hypothetical protein